MLVYAMALDIVMNYVRVVDVIIYPALASIFVGNFIKSVFC